MVERRKPSTSEVRQSQTAEAQEVADERAEANQPDLQQQALAEGSMASEKVAEPMGADELEALLKAERKRADDAEKRIARLEAKGAEETPVDKSRELTGEGTHVATALGYLGGKLYYEGDVIPEGYPVGEWMDEADEDDEDEDDRPRRRRRKAR
jgi:hypothetical protein